MVSWLSTDQQPCMIFGAPRPAVLLCLQPVLTSCWVWHADLYVPAAPLCPVYSKKISACCTLRCMHTRSLRPAQPLWHACTSGSHGVEQYQCCLPTHKAPQPAQLLRSKGHTEPGFDSTCTACLQGANCTACLAAGIQTGGVLRPARTHQGENSLSRCKPMQLLKGPL